MGIGAHMIVKNQTNSRINTTISDVTCVWYVKPKFDNLGLDPYKSSDWLDIQADSDPDCNKQKHFQINYLNGSIGIDIGMLLWNTAVTLNSNPAQIQAVLAPNFPALGIPSSFNFYLYGGPGVLAPLVQSVIDANLAALTKAVSEHPLAGGIIKDINFSVLSCPYAAAVPAETNILDFSAILKMSGTVSGKLGGVSVTDLIILIEGKIDLSSVRPKISVTVFKCSLGSCKLSLEFLLALVAFLILLPIFGRLAPIAVALVTELVATATSPNAVAGIINNGTIIGKDVNKTILDAINDALGSF